MFNFYDSDPCLILVLEKIAFFKCLELIIFDM